MFIIMIKHDMDESAAAKVAAERHERDRVKAAAEIARAKAMAPTLTDEEKEQRAIELAAKARVAKFKAQFNEYGEHIALRKAIVQYMNSPLSYEHINTDVEAYGMNIMVTTTFRGKNAFGNRVVNTIRAVIDDKGNILEIEEL